MQRYYYHQPLSVLISTLEDPKPQVHSHATTALISKYLLFFASIIFKINLDIAITVGHKIFCLDSNTLIQLLICI